MTYNDIIKVLSNTSFESKMVLAFYVTFICNPKLARQYGLVNLDIEWDKVKVGINRRISQNIEDGEARERHTESIGDLKDYSEGEKEAYLLIQNSRQSLHVMFEKNRREYVRLMNEAPYDAFVLLADKRFNLFDKEMAAATVYAFKKVDNPTKAQFPSYFEGMWGHYRSSFDASKKGVEKTKQGFEALKKHLTELCGEYTDQPFKKKYTGAFIEVVDRLLTNLKMQKGDTHLISTEKTSSGQQ